MTRFSLSVRGFSSCCRAQSRGDENFGVSRYAPLKLMKESMSGCGRNVKWLLDFCNLVESAAPNLTCACQLSPPCKAQEPAWGAGDEPQDSVSKLTIDSVWMITHLNLLCLFLTILGSPRPEALMLVKLPVSYCCSKSWDNWLTETSREHTQTSGFYPWAAEPIALGWGQQSSWQQGHVTVCHLLYHKPVNKRTDITARTSVLLIDTPAGS